MARRPHPDRVPRATARLTLQAIVAAGIAVADREGLDAVSMRRLAQELSVNPMSLYHHVQDKDALLEAMADAVVAEVDHADERPDASASAAAMWTEELRQHLWAARRVMRGHPWAAEVIQKRGTPTPSTLRHLDRLLDTMRRGGCSVELGHHALHLLGSRMLGFSQDLFVESPRGGAEAPDSLDLTRRAAQARAMAELYPHISELARVASHESPLDGCDDDAEFDFALDVLLDGLERRRLAETVLL